MVYRVPPAAPQSQVAPDRRGQVMGRYCLVCASLYPLHRATHTGRPVYGRDHIASPCAHEGDVFVAGAAWWEPGVEVLPAPSPPPQPAAPAPATPAASAPAQPSGATASPAPAAKP
ncbi:MAG TPA: hypothetical protein VMW75_12045 [Thermoanaerobaculia bacterium]|nr:hypothetical protein [Thermoanaerobaculia bacterium]